MHEPFDPRVPHPARVYSYWLGGKDHYPADREAGDEVARLRPEVVAAARANRAFGQLVTGYAARPQPRPQEQAAELQRASARFPAYEITPDLTAGRPRYAARARHLSTHPYLVIATTLDELTAELSSAQA